MFRKKILSLLSAALLIVAIASLALLPASASEPAVLEGEKITFADVGREYPYHISFTNPSISNIEGLVLEVEWDPKALSYSGNYEADASLAGAQVMVGAKNASEGKLSLAVAAFSEILPRTETPYDLFSLGFTVLPGAALNNPITLRVVNLGNASKEYASRVTVKTGYISVDLPENVVYVADNGTGDGSSPDNPIGHASGYDGNTTTSYQKTAFYRALDLVKNENATVVIVGPTTVGYCTASVTTGNWYSPTGAANKTVTITSSYNGVDYREQGAKLIYDMTRGNPRMHFRMNTVWDHMEFSVQYNSATSGTGYIGWIAFNGFNTYIGSDFLTTQYNISVSTTSPTNLTHKYIALAGGMLWGAQLAKDYTFEICGGTYYQIYTTNQFGNASNASEYVGHAQLIMTNVTVCGTVYATSTSNGSYTEEGTTKYYYNCLASGEIDITVNSGSYGMIMFGRNAFSDDDSILHFKINGGTYKSGYGLVFWGSGGSNFPSGVHKGTRILDFSGMSKSQYDNMTVITSSGEIPLNKSYNVASSLGAYGAGANSTSGFEQIIPPTDVTVSSLSVKTPGKTAFTPGEYFDIKDYVFTASYSDGSVETIENGMVSFDKTEQLTTSDSKVTFSYSFGTDTVTAEQDIFVGYRLKSLTLKTAGKTTYNAGETFDPSGFVFTAEKYDGSISDVNGSLVTFPAKTLKSSDTTVTVGYTDGEVTKYCDVNVTVIGVFSSLGIGTKGKTDYYKGESFDLTDFVFTIKYEDGSSVNADPAALTVSPAVLNDNSIAQVTVSLTLGGVTKSVNVPVTVVLGAKTLNVVTYGRQNYQTNEVFDPTGYSFSVTYSDGTSASLELRDLLIPEDLLKPTASSVSVSYTLNGSTAVAQIPVSVKNVFGLRDGDSNSDGKINILDLLTIEAYLKNYISLIAEEIESADIDGDSVLTTADSEMLFGKLTGEALVARYANDIAVNPLGEAEFLIDENGTGKTMVITVETINGVAYADAVKNFTPSTFFLVTLSDMTGKYAVDTIDFASFSANNTISFSESTGKMVPATAISFDGMDYVLNEKTQILVWNAEKNLVERATGLPVATAGTNPWVDVTSNTKFAVWGDTVIFVNAALHGLFR